MRAIRGISISLRCKRPNECLQLRSSFQHVQLRSRASRGAVRSGGSYRGRYRFRRRWVHDSIALRTIRTVRVARACGPSTSAISTIATVSLNKRLHQVFQLLQCFKPCSHVADFVGQSVYVISHSLHRLGHIGIPASRRIIACFRSSGHFHST